MGSIFCTSCGQGAAADTRFCSNCGRSFLAQEPDAPVDWARKWISSWVMPFNASLVFGTTLVCVFDFVSPRIALLPIAATLALASLAAMVCLRKFVAPSMPDTSRLKRLLAPGFALHRSPVLVASGMLSLLMVTGAAWSHVAAAGGGVVASKFDAARNVQMQLGLLQGVQKEQRVQTAVLEDIREGRTSNPRRELANQGILWKIDDLNRAVESGDVPVVELFLAGGMQWSIRTIKSAVERDDQAMLPLFFKYPQLLKAGDSCGSSIDAVWRSKVGNFRKNALTYRPQKVLALTATDVRLLKLFCTKPGDLAYAKESLQREKQQYQEKLKERLTRSSAIGAAPGTRRTSAECLRDLTADNGQWLVRLANAYVPYDSNCGPMPCISYGMVGSENLLSQLKKSMPQGATGLSAHNLADIKAYCENPEYQKSEFDDFDVQMLELVLQALD